MNAIVPTSPAAIRILDVDRTPPRRYVDADVLAHRMGRIALGAGLFVGAAFAATLTLTGALDERIGAHVLTFMVASWTCALLGWLAVPPIACRVLRKGRGRTNDELLRASLVVPAVGLSLFGPATLHAPFALLIGGVDGLDGWTMMSLGIVGHAHVVLAILAARRALKLVEHHQDEDLRRNFPARAMSPRRIYWIVVVVSAVPGILFLGIPPILTMITGVAAFPLLHGIEDTIVSERARLDEANRIWRDDSLLR